MNRSVLALLLGIVGARHLTAVEPPARVLKVVTGATPISMAINPATGQLFSLGPVGHLSIIDEVTRRSSAITVSSDALGLTVDSLANRVYVTSSALSIGGWFGGLTVVDPSSGHTDFINASYLGLPTANSSTHQVYVTNPYLVYHTGVGFHSSGSSTARRSHRIPSPSRVAYPWRWRSTKRTTGSTSPRSRIPFTVRRL